MSFIEKSVARLEQLERLEVLAVELGRSHYRYNAPPKYYSVRHTHWQCMLSKVTVCISIDIDIDHFLFWCDLFPVCRSRIHLCCPTHSQREMDPWAWGGMEGTDFSLSWRPLWFNMWVSITCSSSDSPSTNVQQNALNWYDHVCHQLLSKRSLGFLLCQSYSHPMINVKMEMITSGWDRLTDMNISINQKWPYWETSAWLCHIM